MGPDRPGDEILSSEERARIRAEEVLRREIRDSFETKQNRWWVFLNSAFGLWLLGSATVGALTWSFGAIRDRQRERAELLEADFNKWRRRTVNAAELGAPDYMAARRGLDKKFVTELAAVNQQVRRACE